jgi:hypothetical protein
MADEYYTKPHIKERLWEQIVEAAKVVVRYGGEGIRFVPNIEDSERMQREMKRNGKE